MDLKKAFGITLPVAAVALIFITIAGCDKANKKDVIAYVNNEPVLESELRRDIELRAKIDPNFRITPDTHEEQLAITINRKLIIQDAIKSGLAREDRFVTAIKSFWEQTLIRDYLDKKRKEFNANSSVSEADINNYYANLGFQITFKVMRSRDKKYIDDAYEAVKKDPSSPGLPWQETGPVGYDDIRTGPLMDIINMKLGEIRVIEEKPFYFLVVMSAKDKKDLEPLENMRAEIKARVLEQKERMMFDNWIKGARGKAKIKIVAK